MVKMLRGSREARTRSVDAPTRTGRRVALTVASLVLVLLAVFPDVAHACPVCFDRDDEARIAFLATTGLLTLLPLGLVVGTGMWLRRRARELEEEERGEG